MKLTNKQLKSIIKQELNNVLKEMRYPGGHPDQEFLKKVRRDDAGIPPEAQEMIREIEKVDPAMARELAAGFGSQEYLEPMSGEPANVLELKTKILELHKEAVEILFDIKYKSYPLKDVTAVLKPLVARRNKLEAKLSALTGKHPERIETWRNQKDEERREKLGGFKSDLTGKSINKNVYYK